MVFFGNQENRNIIKTWSECSCYLLYISQGFQPRGICRIIEDTVTIAMRAKNDDITVLDGL